MYPDIELYHYCEKHEWPNGPNPATRYRITNKIHREYREHFGPNFLNIAYSMPLIPLTAVLPHGVIPYAT
jgi:hypothetical protein